MIKGNVGGLDPKQRWDESLQPQVEWLRVMLNSIRDAVIIANDPWGGISFMNPVLQCFVVRVRNTGVRLALVQRLSEYVRSPLG